MILCNTEIQRAIDAGRLIIRPEPWLRRPTEGQKCPYDTHSVNLTLAGEISIPRPGTYVIDLTRKGKPGRFPRPDFGSCPDRPRPRIHLGTESVHLRAGPESTSSFHPAPSRHLSGGSDQGKEQPSPMRRPGPLHGPDRPPRIQGYVDLGGHQSRTQCLHAPAGYDHCAVDDRGGQGSPVRECQPVSGPDDSRGDRLDRYRCMRIKRATPSRSFVGRSRSCSGRMSATILEGTGFSLARSESTGRWTITRCNERST